MCFELLGDDIVGNLIYFSFWWLIVTHSFDDLVSLCWVTHSCDDLVSLCFWNILIVVMTHWPSLTMLSHCFWNILYYNKKKKAVKMVGGFICLHTYYVIKILKWKNTYLIIMVFIWIIIYSCDYQKNYLGPFCILFFEETWCLASLTCDFRSGSEPNFLEQ